MPQFSPGEARTAIAPITAKPAGISCEAELFLGPNENTKVATSGLIPFVSSGAVKNVNLPIVMPSTQGTYQGFIDVFAESIRFLAYKTTEDVVIAAPELPLSMVITNLKTEANKFSPAFWGVGVTALISNPHSVNVERKIRCMLTPGDRDPNLLSSYIWTRLWRYESIGEQLPVTLDQGKSISVYNPVYTIYDVQAGGAEGTNYPLLSYHGGIRLKYWIRIVDDLDNWSPVASVGTYA